MEQAAATCSPPSISPVTMGAQCSQVETACQREAGAHRCARWYECVRTPEPRTRARPSHRLPAVWAVLRSVSAGPRLLSAPEPWASLFPGCFPGWTLTQSPPVASCRSRQKGPLCHSLLDPCDLTPSFTSIHPQSPPLLSPVLQAPCS